MKRMYLTLRLTLIMGLLLFMFQAHAQAPELVNPNATQKAKDVYRYIYNLKTQGLMTGQHNYSRTWSLNDLAIRATNSVKNNLGHYPGLWGSDFSFTDPNYSIAQLQDARQRMIQVAKAQADAGSIITLTYHMVTPKLEENDGWSNVQQARLTMDEYQQLVTPGTTLYNNWKRNMDRIIPFLKELQNEGYAVVWRPYHEMNGLFWWGGGDAARTHFKTLWINTYNYMVKTHGLNNLIWFWCPNHFTSWNNDRVPDPWFPGLAYVDMLGIDDYYWNQSGFLSQGDYDYLVTKAQGKPLAIGEGYNVNMVLPSVDWMMQNRPEYRWFMLWDGEWIDTRLNDPVKKAALAAIYNHKNAINQEDVYIPSSGVVDNTPPSTPTSLRSTSVESSLVGLAWNASSDNVGVAGYKVFVNGVEKKTSSSASTTVTGLLPNTSYSIGVSAYDAAGNVSSKSSLINVVTTSSDPVTSINDTQFTFSSGWSISSGTGKYLDDDHYSSVTGSYWEYTFFGTQVKMYGALASHHGIANVSLNGGSAVSVDFYASVRQNEQLVWTSPVLTQEQHTIRVSVSGQKNSASTGNTIVADRLDVYNVENTNVPVTGVSLSSSSASIVNNSTKQLTATVSPTNATNKAVSWSTSNSSIATVSNGLVSAVGEGSAIITVTTVDGNKKATCSITITPSSSGGGGTPSQNLILNPGFESSLQSWTVSKGDAVAATTDMHSGSKALRIGSTSWSWVQQNLQGYKAGSTYTFSAWGKAASNGNKVDVAIKNGSATIKTLSFTSTSYVQLSAEIVIPLNSTWVQVFVTNGSSGSGFVDDIALYEGAADVPVSGVSVSFSSVALLQGETSQLSAAVSPSNATNKNISWTSSNSAVATVSSNGLVSALSAGSATVTVTTQDGSKKATSLITVTSPSGGGGTPSQNLILNPGFESSLQSWTVTKGDVVVVTNEVQSGSKALRVGSTSWSWVQQNVLGYEVGETYSFSAWGKVLSAGNRVDVAIKNGSTTIQTLSFTGTTYEQLNAEIVIPANTTWLQVFITNRTQGVGFVDDVVLTNGESLKNSTLEMMSTSLAEQSEIQVWINNGVLSVENAVDYQLNLFSLSGSLILNKKINEKCHTEDISNRLKGMYVVRLVSGNKVITKKVVNK